MSHTSCRITTHEKLFCSYIYHEKIANVYHFISVPRSKISKRQWLTFEPWHSFWILFTNCMFNDVSNNLHLLIVTLNLFYIRNKRNFSLDSWTQLRINNKPCQYHNFSCPWLKCKFKKFDKNNQYDKYISRFDYPRGCAISSN